MFTACPGLRVNSNVDSPVVLEDMSIIDGNPANGLFSVAAPPSLAVLVVVGGVLSRLVARTGCIVPFSFSASSFSSSSISGVFPCGGRLPPSPPFDPLKPQTQDLETDYW
jgi:hypothetical protein